MTRARWQRWMLRLQSSLWLAPATASFAAIGLVNALTRIDRHIPQDAEGWYLFTGSADSARALLSAIASSLMTLTGVVFSITIVVLQLASSQFSPRVIRTFLEDRLTRFSLGALIGSFVYAIALLPEVHGPTPDREEFVPALAVFVAYVVVLFGTGVFVRYIHHMAHSIRAVNVVRRIAIDARETLEAMFPEHAVDPPEAAAALPPPDEARILTNRCGGGVVASVDCESLVAYARARDLVIEMIPEVGAFVPAGAPLFRVWGDGSCEAPDPCAHVMLTVERTAHQDPAFGFRQLVDIAEKALSSALNDPTTAIQAFDAIHDLLRTLAVRRIPPASHADAEGRVRLVVPSTGWDAYVHLAFDEIRQYGESSLQVVRRLRAGLEDLLTVAPPDRRPALVRQLDLLDEALVRGFPSRERDVAREPDDRGV